MTIQQFEYIVALNKYRHFAKAAESCKVTQSTLSAMIQKLEEEFDIIIFDRKSHPVCPTPLGSRLIAQAETVLDNARQFQALAQKEKEQSSGEISMGIIPTIAPYILPSLLSQLRVSHPLLHLKVSELTTSEILDRFKRNELDIALLATPLDNPTLLEIPVYYEKFVAYVSPQEPLYSKSEIRTTEMPTTHMWLLKEGHCLRNQVVNFCGIDDQNTSSYEAGSLDTIVRIVDANDGYTILPELHVSFLSKEQQKHVRPLINPEPNREISLVVRHDFAKERIVNILANAIKHLVPEHMIDEHLKKFSIRL